MEHTDTHAGTGQGASAGDSSDTEVERRLRQAQAAEAMDHEVRLVLLAWKRTAPVSCLADADVALARAVCAHLRSGQSLGMAGTVRRWAVEQSDAAAMVRELSSLRRSVAVLGDPDPVAVDALFDRLSSLAVEQAMTTLHAEARTDVLTSTGNRRAFDDRIEQVLAVSCRRGHPFAVCFVDLDGLKDVNDRLGHRTGDSRLRQTAEAVRSGMRVEDEVFRVGGDEFAVLMPFCTR
ncbi:MAG TPA: GGDEF domain-containing protein, partial [Acidimicrobiales bacterium]|nr:GGDEF domain-containing protein [Acidimicrobiales bacterium]